MIRLALIFALVLSGLPTGWSQSGPATTSTALESADLASDTAWTISLDDGPARKIKVPSGGYNSDRQDAPLIAMCVDPGYSVSKTGYRDVLDHATYKRQIRIPKVRDDQVTLIEFGAVNHGAEVFLSDGTTEKRVGAHAGPLMPFSVDLTGLVTPGKEYTLKVKAYTLWHYTNAVPVGFIYLEGWLNASKPGQWASKFSFGITKYARLAIYPSARISDVFVKPSVSRDTLSAEVTVRNDSAEKATFTLTGALSSWSADSWKYPAFAPKEVVVPAKSAVRAQLGPVAWGLGSNSYWWPNKPFREDYKANLHLLNLTLSKGTNEIDKRAQRFGFVEWGETPMYYTVNGTRINFIGDGTPEAAMSEYDCYSTAAAFLPPGGSSGGCPETWRRYMRMGISVNRTHQSTPTQYMMDAADETGFMLIPETAIRGCQRQTWDDQLLPQSARELALFCRGHPSVCRYSVMNEAPPDWVPQLVDALASADDTRPMVFEDNHLKAPASVEGTNGHAVAMLHYVLHTRPATRLTGVGEIAWADWNNMGDGPEVLGYLIFDARCQNVAYYAGWDWINYWPNFLEGMNSKRHSWKQLESWHEDRADNIDGWNSPLMLWMQKCFHPYLATDAGFMLINGQYNKEWPRKMPTYTPGQPITRDIVMFNDSLQDGSFELRWSARWGGADGGPVTNAVIPAIPIKAGFHVTETIELTAPPTNAKRLITLILESYKDGKQVFRDDQVCLGISPKAGE